MLLIVLLMFCLVIPKVDASEGIQIKQNFEYKLDTFGDAKIEQKILLTNIDDEIYSKGYRLILKNLKPINIKAWDEDGNILKKVTNKTIETEIDLLFNKPALGSGQTKEIIIDYGLNKFGVKKGNTVEMAIPENKNDGVIKIEIPNGWGELAWSSIRPKLITNFNNKKQIFFENQKDKINLIFGNFQIFDVNIKYNLTNNTTNNFDTEIAIPPERDSQEVVILKLEPEAKSIRKDNDGNWLLKYNLKAGEKKIVQLEEQIKVFPLGNRIIEKDLSDYLKETNYWPINNSEIKQVSDYLNSTRDIYSYVVNYLNYDYENIFKERKGGLWALRNPDNSLCTEFSDLFISLCRAKSIPARELEGYALNINNGNKPVNIDADILHSWPEYYDKEKEVWRAVDPTWQKTTGGINYFDEMDLNHIVFVVHGIEDNYPPVPGSYKGTDKKNVIVNLAKEEVKKNFDNVEIKIDLANFFRKQKMRIINKNPNSIENGIFEIRENDWKYRVKEMLPGESVEVDMPKMPWYYHLLPKYRIINIYLTHDDGEKLIKVKNQNYYLELFLLTSIVLTTVSASSIMFLRE